MASPDFSLKMEHLRGLPFYEAKITQASVKIETDCDALSAQFRCTAVVLAVLALLAAGGSAALIVLSHGPYVHLSYFVSGVVLGVASIVFLVWMAITYAYSSGQKEALENSSLLQGNQPVKIEDLLQVMTQAETPEINGVLKVLNPISRGYFIAETYREFFEVDDPQPLNPGQKKVVNAFTTIEDELILAIQSSDKLFAWNLIKNIEPASLTDGIIQALISMIGAPTNEAEANWLLSHFNLLEGDRDRDFAILKHVSANPDSVAMLFLASNPSSEDEAKSVLRHPDTMIEILKWNNRDFARELLRFAPQGQEPAILDALFKKLGKPQNEQEAQILALHPEALLRFLNSSKDDGLIAGYPALVVSLAIKHPLIFTPQIISKIYPKMDNPQTDRVNETLFLTLMANARDQKDQTHEIQQIIEAAVQPLIADLITGVITRKKDPTKGSAEYMNLLVVLGRWPCQAAESLFKEGFTKKPILGKEMSVLTAIYTQMHPPQQTLFKQIAVDTLSSRKDAIVIYLKLITLALANPGLKVPLFEIMAQTPLLMAEAMNEKDMGTEIVKMMTEPQKVVYRQQYMKIFKAKNDAPTVIASLTQELLKTSPEKLSSSYALAYFIAFPKDLKVMVIENDRLGEDLLRGQLALNLLELMGEEAEVAIEDLDSSTLFGYPYYNYLINQLVKEAQKPVTSELRARLMARFDLAYNKGKKIIEVTRTEKPAPSTFFFPLFGGDERLLLDSNHPGWVNFNSAAGSQMGNVYKHKKS